MSLDIKLTEGGDITVPTLIASGEDLVIQKARIRTERLRGEWIKDSRVGVPWFEWLETKPAPLVEIEDFLRAEYEEISGVRRAVVSAELTDDKAGVDIEATLYINQDDAEGQTLTATPPPERPVVLRATFSPGIL